MSTALTERPPCRGARSTYRSIIFRDGDEVEIGSRNKRPMTRFFPEVVEAVRANFVPRAVIDGVTVANLDGNTLDFEALQQRIHPAPSRVKMLAIGDHLLMNTPLAERRAALQQALGNAQPPIHITPATQDVTEAQRWFEEFEGAGLDGLIAKKLDPRYQPDKRVMSKIKHERTADCVVAGYRVVPGAQVGARHDRLGAAGPLGRSWAAGVGGCHGRVPDGDTPPRKNESCRWNVGKDLSFVPLRPEKVVEVRDDYMEGERFRHTAQFVRWRPDRKPGSCTYDQLDRPVRVNLADVLISGEGPE